MIKKFMVTISSITAFIILQFMPVSDAVAGICSLSNSSAINITINEQIQLTPSTSAPSVTSVLYSRSFPTAELQFTCTGSSTQWESVYSRGYVSTSIDHIYHTEISGIGIRIKWPASYSESFYVPGSSVPCLSSCNIPADTITLEFLHIGPVDAAEQIIPAGEIVKSHFLNDNGTPVIMTFTLGSNVVITPKSCAIYPSSNYIDLGTYDAATLTNAGATGVTAVGFSLHVSCPISSTIVLMFETANTVFSSGDGDIGASANSVPGLSVRVKFNPLNLPTFPNIVLDRNYTYFNVMERTFLLQAQMFVKDTALFASSGGAGTVNSNLLYTMTIR